MEVEDLLIRGRALTQILGNAIEVYKHECAGVLLGDIFTSAKKAVVNSAVALQSAKRGFSHVETSDKRYARIEEVLSFLALDWIVGEFHSHTDWGQAKPSYQLSDIDEKYIFENHYPGEIEIVVCLRRKRRNYPWGYIDQERVLRGTLGDYEVEIAAYCLSGDEIAQSSVWAPITEVANLANEVGLAPKFGYIFEFIPPEFNKNKFRQLVRLIRKYEDITIKTMDIDAGEDTLSSIEKMIQEVAAITDIYWNDE
jgi:proteasome lid subunit RPN8/RPN11